MNRERKVIHLFQASGIVDPFSPDPGFRIRYRVPGKDHVVGRNLLTVRPIDVVAQLPGDGHFPGHGVGDHPAIFDGGQLGSQFQEHVTLSIEVSQAQHGQLHQHLFVAGVAYVGVESGRILRNGDDDAGFFRLRGRRLGGRWRFGRRRSLGRLCRLGSLGGLFGRLGRFGHLGWLSYHVRGLGWLGRLWCGATADQTAG